MAKTIAAVLVSSRFDYCNSIFTMLLSRRSCCSQEDHVALKEIMLLSMRSCCSQGDHDISTFAELFGKGSYPVFLFVSFSTS